MASVNVTEYATMARDDQGHITHVGQEPALARYDIASGQGPVFQERTRFIRIKAKGGNVRWRSGESPTAIVTDTELESGAAEYYGVNKGHRAAIIDSA